MSLNPEPADPEERQAHHLAPKSFADAAHEAVEPVKYDTDQTTKKNAVLKTNGHHVTKSEDEGPSPVRDFHRPFGKSYATAAIDAKDDQTVPHAKQVDKTNGIQTTNGINGDRLATVKPNGITPKKDDMGRSNVLRSRSSNAQLQSGRQAGSGWGNSA